MHEMVEQKLWANIKNIFILNVNKRQVNDDRAIVLSSCVPQINQYTSQTASTLARVIQSSVLGSPCYSDSHESLLMGNGAINRIPAEHTNLRETHICVKALALAWKPLRVLIKHRSALGLCCGCCVSELEGVFHSNSQQQWNQFKLAERKTWNQL